MIRAAWRLLWVSIEAQVAALVDRAASRLWDVKKPSDGWVVDQEAVPLWATQTADDVLRAIDEAKRKLEEGDDA